MEDSTDKDRTIADLRTLIATVEAGWENDESSSAVSSPTVSSCQGQDLQTEEPDLSFPKPSSLGMSPSIDLSSCRRQDLQAKESESVPDSSSSLDSSSCSTVQDLCDDDTGSVPETSSLEDTKPEIITDPEQARTIALHRLSARPRSRAELKKDLVQRHVDESLADQIVARFIEVGLVDDENFAREWVASRRGPKSLSTARLKRELAGKGISPSVIDEALDEADGTEAEIALDLAQRRAKALVGKDRATMTRRLAAQLERRGFSPAIVRRAVIQAVDEALDGTSVDAVG